MVDAQEGSLARVRVVSPDSAQTEGRALSFDIVNFPLHQEIQRRVALIKPSSPRAGVLAVAKVFLASASEDYNALLETKTSDDPWVEKGLKERGLVDTGVIRFANLILAIDEAVTTGKFNAKRLMFGVAKAADMDDARPFHQFKPIGKKTETVNKRTLAILQELAAQDPSYLSIIRRQTDLPYSISLYLQNDPEFVREVNIIIPVYQSALEFLVPTPPSVSK